MGTRYDHPNCIVRREQAFTTVAGAAGVSARMINFQKGRLKAVHAAVVTAGAANSPGNALTIKIGTASVGLIPLGTATAGSTFDVAIAAEDFASDQIISCTNGTDTAGVAVISYEYEISMDANQTA